MMKFTKNEELLNRIEEYISSNNISMSLGDMFSDILGNQNLTNKKEMELLKAKFHKDSRSILLDIYQEYWELDLENEEDEYIFSRYIAPSIDVVNKDKYLNNPYYKTIKIKDVKEGDYSLVNDSYKAYELFPLNDLSFDLDSFVEKNSFSFFESDFSFPAVNYKGVTWMSITPNEIETMQLAINEAKGNVIAYGLGLGYFPFMVSNKSDVTSVTIIEKDRNIISIFKKYLLNQFPNKDKIQIIESDAFEYMKLNKKYDYHFIDLWHDPFDGVELYLKAKKFEKKNEHYFYWLESGCIALLRRCFLSLIEEQLANAGEECYQKSKNFTDKIINKYYKNTKNLIITSEEQLRDLLSDKSLIELILKD